MCVYRVEGGKNAFAPKMTVLGTYLWGVLHINPLRLKWRVCYHRISHLASKLLILEPNEKFDPELENQ